MYTKLKYLHKSLALWSLIARYGFSKIKAIEIIEGTSEVKPINLCYLCQYKKATTGRFIADGDCLVDWGEHTDLYGNMWCTSSNSEYTKWYSGDEEGSAKAAREIIKLHKKALRKLLGANLKWRWISMRIGLSLSLKIFRKSGVVY